MVHFRRIVAISSLPLPVSWQSDYIRIFIVKNIPCLVLISGIAIQFGPSNRCPLQHLDRVGVRVNIQSLQILIEH